MIFNSHLCFVSTSDKALNGLRSCLFWRDTGSIRGLSNFFFRFIYPFSSKTQNIYFKKPYCRVCVESKSTFAEFEPINTPFIIHKISIQFLCHFGSTSDKSLNGPHLCLFWRDAGSIRGPSNFFFRFIYPFSSKTQNIYLKKPYCQVCIKWKSTFEEFEPIDTASIIDKITPKFVCHFVSTSDKALDGPHSCLFWTDTSSIRGLSNYFFLFSSKTLNIYLKKPYCRVCVESKSTFAEFEPINTAFIIHKIMPDYPCDFVSTSDEALKAAFVFVLTWCRFDTRSVKFFFRFIYPFSSKTQNIYLKKPYCQ